MNIMKYLKSCLSCINTVSDKSPSPQRKRAHVYEETKLSKRSKGTGTGTGDVNLKYEYLNYCTVVLEDYSSVKCEW